MLFNSTSPLQPSILTMALCFRNSPLSLVCPLSSQWLSVSSTAICLLYIPIYPLRPSFPPLQKYPPWPLSPLLSEVPSIAHVPTRAQCPRYGPMFPLWPMSPLRPSASSTALYLLKGHMFPLQPSTALCTLYSGCQKYSTHSTKVAHILRDFN
jgi:hypothetical protein